MKRLHVFPIVHGSNPGLSESVRACKPDLVFIEADPRELSRAASGCSKLTGGAVEGEISECMQLVRPGSGVSLVPIDASQKNIRRKLSHRLAAHPGELLRMWRGKLDISDPHVARHEFVNSFPVASSLLFEERERIMAAAVRVGIQDWSRASLSAREPTVAVVLGAAHAQELAELLLEPAELQEDLATLKEAWKSSVPSGVPVLLFFYVLLPVMLCVPWSIWYVWRAKSLDRGDVPLEEQQRRNSPEEFSR